MSADLHWKDQKVKYVKPYHRNGYYVACATLYRGSRPAQIGMYGGGITIQFGGETEVEATATLEANKAAKMEWYGPQAEYRAAQNRGQRNRAKMLDVSLV